MSFSTYYQSCWNNKEWMGDYSKCWKSTPLAGLTFLLAFFFLYVIYGKPLSPCKIKFPEMYSFIFFSKPCPFLHNRLIISQNTEFTIKSYLKPQKLFMWLTELSVARYTLFLWIIKKGTVWIHHQAWDEQRRLAMLYTNRRWECRGEERGGGIGDPSMVWWLFSPFPVAWSQVDRRAIPCMVHKSQNALWVSEWAHLGWKP